MGGSVVELPHPPWVEPPTLLRPGRLARPFRPLVETYGAARYANIDPTPFAALAFVLMFGIMFGDVGHGLLLLLLALLLRGTRRRRFAPYRSLWPIPAAAGLVAAVFGLLYGEAFGPTGIVPTLWLDPLEDPLRLLAVALAVGAVLLAASYGIGIVNRYREGGLGLALVAPSAIAGFAVFLGGALAAAGWYLDETPLLTSGGVVAVVGIVLLASGFVAEVPRGATAVAVAGVEVTDAVIRIGANTISFTRLAAFGLMHAALGAVVFEAAQALWGSVVGAALAVIVFCAGNAAAFALEALVAGVQALRLEYYELFSRVFAGEGRRFAPWKIPVAEAEEAP
jgi:V/A-type H+-transporting ATPase subunit I